MNPNDLQLNDLLPLRGDDFSHPGVVNPHGLRLFACDCAERVRKLFPGEWCARAVTAGQAYATGQGSWQDMLLAGEIALKTIEHEHGEKASFFATTAAAACSQVALNIEANEGTFKGETDEWASVGAARIGAMAARLAEMKALNTGNGRFIEVEQIKMLLHRVPELGGLVHV